MALDTGGVTSLYRTGEYDPSEPPRGGAPGLHDGPDIGAALKTVREFHGVTLQDLSDATRIRQTYLAALEDMRIEELPSRPFAIGYVKAYARHLDLDVEAAVERFRQDNPEHDEGALRAPVGMRKQRDPRLGLVIVAAVVVIAAFALWNVAQRAITAQAPAGPVVKAENTVPPPAAPAGPISVGGYTPPPAESTTPEIYETPGMANSQGGAVDEGGAAARKAAAAGLAPVMTMPIGAPFRAKGAIYGDPEGPAATVIVQAHRSGATLEVKGSDGSSYFARVMQPGEAYRITPRKGMTVAVSEPAAFDVFVAGAYKGPPPGATTAVSTLAQ